MSGISFNYIPLSFISSQDEIHRQVRNTIIFSYLYNKYDCVRSFTEILESTQYGYNSPASSIGTNKFLRISDIKEGVVNWADVPFCDCQDEQNYILSENDILVARTGGTTGKSFQIEDAPKKAVFAGYLIRLRTKRGIDPKLIYEFLNSYTYWAQISEMKMGSAQPNVNAEKLKKLKIPLASKEVLEQVTRLLRGDSYDLPQLEALIELGEKRLSSNQELFELFDSQKLLITKLRQSILQDAVQGKLTEGWRQENFDTEPASVLLEQIKTEKEQLIKEKKIKKEKPLPPISEDEIPYELPEGWEWCRLGNILLYSDAGKSPNCEKRPAEANEWGVLTTTAIQQNKFDEKANKVLPSSFQINPDQIVEKGDILITRAGPTNRTGISCYVDKIKSNLILSDKTIRLKYINGTLNAGFVSLALNSNSIRALLLQKMIGMAASQVNISQANIKRIYFPLPPLDEQKAIVKKVNQLMALCDELEKQVTDSKKDAELLVQAVLKEVFEPKEEMEEVM